jgi:nucleotide-binding universal stress UspA family protein
MASTFKKILMATDFGPESDAALARAVDLARQLGGSIHLLHVVRDPMTVLGAPESYGIDWQKLRDELVSKSRADLEQIASRYKEVVLATDVIIDRPADAIVRRARDVGADLIVMGTHGRGAVGHLFLGSVAERVLRQAPCPVMTVRAVAPQAQLEHESDKVMAPVASEVNR